MSAEMYMILGVGVGLAGLVLTLFVATWQMMNSRFNEVNARFNEVNARFSEVNARFLQMEEHIRQLTAIVAALAERVARLEGLMGVRQEVDGRGDD